MRKQWSIGVLENSSFIKILINLVKTSREVSISITFHSWIRNFIEKLTPLQEVLDSETSKALGILIYVWCIGFPSVGGNLDNISQFVLVAV